MKQIRTFFEYVVLGCKSKALGGAKFAPLSSGLGGFEAYFLLKFAYALYVWGSFPKLGV